MDTIKLILKEYEFSINSIVNSDVYNPIYEYNLIKRTSRTWPKIVNSASADGCPRSRDCARLTLRSPPH